MAEEKMTLVERLQNPAWEGDGSIIEGKARLNVRQTLEAMTEAANEIERLEKWADRYTLPCDVRLPPRTTIRKGCSLSTLITGLIARETIEGEKPHEFSTTDAA